MPISFKIKLVMGGETSFKSNILQDTIHNEEDFYQIGVNFIPLECVLNNGNTYVFIIWDLNSKERFRFMYSKFCKGASAALLYFDISNKKSFTDLDSWIQIFRSSVGQIPIFLISFQSKENVIEVNEEEIDIFAEKNDIDNLFHISEDQQDRVKKKEDIFRRIIENLDPSVQEIHDFSLTFPMEEKNFKEFVDHFGMCPICKKENHIYNLKSFFYSKDPESLLLKSKLIKLYEKDLEYSYSRNISLGIPCCSCYKKYFEK